MKLPKPLLLDGGLSNELLKQGLSLDNPLWTSLHIKDNYDAVVHAHWSYLNAGARCIITSSYQASIPGLIKHGLSHEEAVAMIHRSVAAAVEARELYRNTNPESPQIYIAASIGPYGAMLGDGSEYRGDYRLSLSGLMAFHSERLSILDESSIDFFACETIPSFLEAKALANLLNHTQKKGWISFSCKDGQHIADGTPISDCIQFLANHKNVFALGVNCVKPEYVSDLIRSIKPYLKDKKLIVYPNSGENYDANTKEWLNNKHADFCANAGEWLSQGVDIIGGCCQIGPKEIKQLSGFLSS